MNNYQNLIATDYQVMLGKPVINGTRITVELILRKLAQGASTIDLLKMYPELELIQIEAALAYAADLVSNEEYI